MPFTTLLAAAAFGNPCARVTALWPDLQVADGGEPCVREFDGLSPGIAFNELVPSWNVTNPEASALKIELRADFGGRRSKWYTLADWAFDSDRSARASVEGQKDGDGDVATDTWRLASLVETFDVRVTLRKVGAGAQPLLRMLTFSCLNTQLSLTESQERSLAWGKVVEVPERAQGNYPNGGVLCSATSVSMLLDYWSKTLNRPELDHDVPVVEKGVWDSVYKGAGNWSFNASFAGSLPGMVGYAARLTSLADLERWIEAGIPVACSAPLDVLEGVTRQGDSGHLIVVVGFTETGDPVVNDPAHRAQVRRIYPRARFAKAWAESNRTVYLIYPSTKAPPTSGGGTWLENSVTGDR